MQNKVYNFDKLSEKTLAGERYLLLYLPWLLSLLISNNPIASYLTAWAGSFLIFFLTLTGNIRAIPNDLSIPQQFMRPIFLTQIIFASYMCLTSIFYFSSVLGYENFEAPVLYVPDYLELELVAKCQRYYCLGHAAMVTGILFFMNYEKSEYRIDESTLPNFLLKFALITLPIALLFKINRDLYQFYNQLATLSFTAGTLALAYAIPKKKALNTLICSFLYISNLITALLSGFKEPVIVSVLILGIFLYPYYKKLIYIIFLPFLFFLMSVLPAYVNTFRLLMSSGSFTVEEASSYAIEDIKTQDESEKAATNWAFLTSRLSEIEMFTKYARSTPDIIDYYGLELVEQSIMSIIPRMFWSKKPITEHLVMERVYAADVIERGAIVSAKPQVAVDAYLSGGVIAVFVTFIIYGALAQLISVKAEKLFGGYVIGTALIYSGLFQMLWRGLTFEFLVNSVFWSLFTMFVIFKILKGNRILKKIQ
ncbi:MAG TPA: hypothetical protein VGB63_03935 [Pedobacter sp.]|jgi:hypothetical protein